MYGVASYSDSSPTSSKDFNYQINSHNDASLHSNKASHLSINQSGNNLNSTSSIDSNSSGGSSSHGVKIITSMESFYDAYDCLSMKSDEGLQRGMYIYIYVLFGLLVVEWLVGLLDE